MASRYPLVVNTAIPRIEELKGVDDLNLSQSNVELSNGFPTALNDILRYNGTEIEWISGDSFIGSLGGFTGVVRQSETQTLTNKTISGALNTLVDIPNSALVNPFITFGTQTVFLGDSIGAIDTDSRYEITAANGGVNAVDFQLDVYNLENAAVSNPTPNGDTAVKLQVAGDLLLAYDSPSKTITITSTFVDTNTTYSPAGDGGLSVIGTSFSLKNSGALSDDTILKWDNTGNQLVNSSLIETATDLSTTLNLEVPSFISSGNSTIGVGSLPIRLQFRSGNGITRQNTTLRAVLTTDGLGNTTESADLFYDSSTVPNIRNSTWKISAEDGTIGAVAQVTSTTVPSANNDNGTPGQIRFDATHIYFCVDTDSWIRAVRDTF